MVINKFRELFGKEHKCTVNGFRPSPLECKALGVPSGVYVVDLQVDGVQLCEARSRDWRKAYKLLKIEVEKLYADGQSCGAV